MLLIGGFFVATRLEPDPEGFGTHRQLGLPPCTVREALGVPCPSCGMTTSFAHFVRGQWIQAAQANAAGLLLAVLCAVQIPFALKFCITGRFRSVDSASEIFLACLAAVTLAAVIQWGVRLCL